VGTHPFPIPALLTSVPPGCISFSLAILAQIPCQWVCCSPHLNLKEFGAGVSLHLHAWHGA
jgi:hypothetical protein